MRCAVAVTSTLAFLFVSLFADALAAQRRPDLFAVGNRARDGGRFAMLLRQFRADEPTLPERSEAGFREATAQYQSARDIPPGFWVWQKPYWFVFRDGPDAAVQQRQWGPEAASGAPDTPAAGDQGTAWATKEQDQAGEWLLLEYDAPVRATSLEVHETFNPGAIAAVSIFTPQGDEIEVWTNRAVGAAADARRVLQLDLPLGFDVERVKLSLHSDQVPGWNEIDAVGLRDDKGVVHWARRATASSTYADAAPGAAAPGGGRRLALGGAMAMRGVNLQVQVQPLAVQRFAVQAPQFNQRVVVQGLAAPQPLNQRIALQGLLGDAAEKAKLQARIAELEAKVAQLEAELAKARAGKEP